MRKLLLSALLLASFGFAQEEPYQVPGFPPFAPAPQMLEVVEDRGDTVVVRHLMGETEVPKNPQRVYTDASTFETAVSLGMIPVASERIDTAPMPPALASQVQETTLYPRQEINLEAIVAAEPDLIIAYDLNQVAWNRDETVYAQLSAIAPTIVLQSDAFVFWGPTTRALAEVFGLEERAEAVLSDYQASVQTQCGRIRGVVGEESVTVVMASLWGFYVIGPGYEFEGVGYIPYDTGRIYSTCELTPGPELARLVGAEPAVEISLEILPELQADHLIVYLLGGDEVEATLAQYTEHPLWNSIPAVQQGNVYIFQDLADPVGYYTSTKTLTRAADIITGESD
jgi:iron complex transport system substrate-binding protein